MQVIRAAAAGMCFGVRDALAAMAAIEETQLVTIAGELVHNPAVLQQLSERGFKQQAEEDRAVMPATPTVLITAHGTSHRRMAELHTAGKQVIDTTCPLVRRVHQAAQQLAAAGRLVVVIGRRGHVEVAGVVEDLPEHAIAGSVEQVEVYPSTRLGIVSQTTMPPELVEQIARQIALLNPLADIRLVDTICRPTRERQQAVLDLLPSVDAVVVVGGRNSHNTRQLVALCHANQTPAVQVERAEQLDPDWFADCRTVGLTAGTSTLDTTIDQVHTALANLQPAPGAIPCQPAASRATCASPLDSPTPDRPVPSASDTPC